MLDSGETLVTRQTFSTRKDGRMPDYDEEEPTCDICGESQSAEWGEENDWNGETGNHLSCEEWTR